MKKVTAFIFSILVITMMTFAPVQKADAFFWMCPFCNWGGWGPSWYYPYYGGYHYPYYGGYHYPYYGGYYPYSYSYHTYPYYDSFNYGYSPYYQRRAPYYLPKEKTED